MSKVLSKLPEATQLSLPFPFVISLLSPSSEKNQNDDVRSLKYLQDAMRVMSHRPCERHRNAEKRENENLKKHREKYYYKWNKVKNIEISY